MKKHVFKTTILILFFWILSASFTLASEKKPTKKPETTDLSCNDLLTGYNEQFTFWFFKDLAAALIKHSKIAPTLVKASSAVQEVLNALESSKQKSNQILTKKSFEEEFLDAQKSTQIEISKDDDFPFDIEIVFYDFGNGQVHPVIEKLKFSQKFLATINKAYSQEGKKDFNQIFDTKQLQEVVAPLSKVYIAFAISKHSIDFSEATTLDILSFSHLWTKTIAALHGLNIETTSVELMRTQLGISDEENAELAKVEWKEISEAFRKDEIDTIANGYGKGTRNAFVVSVHEDIRNKGEETTKWQYYSTEIDALELALEQPKISNSNTLQLYLDHGFLKNAFLDLGEKAMYYIIVNELINELTSLFKETLMHICQYSAHPGTAMAVYQQNLRPDIELIESARIKEIVTKSFEDFIYNEIVKPAAESKKQIVVSKVAVVSATEKFNDDLALIWKAESKANLIKSYSAIDRKIKSLEAKKSASTPSSTKGPTLN